MILTEIEGNSLTETTNQYILNETAGRGADGEGGTQLTQAQVEDASSTVFGSVSGERLAQSNAKNNGERVDISSGSATIDLSTDRNKLYFSLTGDSAITANNKTLFKDFEIIFRHGALGPFTCSWNTVDLGLAAAADAYEYFVISLPATDYKAAVKYQIGNYVLAVGIFYKSLTADNTGNTPIEGVNWTVEEPPFHIYGAGEVPLVIP